MTITSALENLNNAILDLQLADHNTYERPVKKVAAALNAPELKAANKRLRDNVDFEDFIENSNRGGSISGSSQLKWPLETEHELGLILQIIEKAGNDPSWLLSFTHQWFYDGNKIIAGVRKFTRSILIPFARDYKTFIANLSSTGGSESKISETLSVPDRLEQNKIPILYISKQVLQLIEEFRERVRGDNKLSPDDRDAALEALETLHELTREANQMSEIQPEDLIENEDVQSWPRRFKSAIEENLQTVADPMNLASAAVPTGLILGFGALGALIAGPAGFGAGSLLGHLITGQLKPGTAAKEIEKGWADDS